MSYNNPGQKEPWVGRTENVYIFGRKPNRFQYSHSQPCRNHDISCSMQPTLGGEHWRLLSTVPSVRPIPAPSTFLKVLQSWGNIWFWDHMSVSGGTPWLDKSILEGTLVAVTDGSYIRELFPNLCSVAFVLECMQQRSW